MIQSVGELLSERARIMPDLEALADLPAGVRLDYRAFDRLVNQTVRSLAPHLEKGDRFAVLAANSRWYGVLMFAAARLGVILVPLNCRLTAPELAYQLGDCEPKVVIFDGANAAVGVELRDLHPEATWMSLETETDDLGPSLASRAAAAETSELKREVGREDGFLILYTSGTTGRPKGALHTHGSTLAWCASSIASLENRLGDRQLLVAPYFHIAGICLLLNAVHRGFTQVIAGDFDPDDTWRLIDEEKINSMFAVPTMINMMRESPARKRFNRDSLRWIMCGAAPVPITLIDVYAEMRIDVHQVYGSTEVHGGVAVLPPAYAHSKKGSTGVACFGLELRVVDQDGNDTAPGERGEIIARGPHVFKEYWRRPEETRASFKDGWFYLGDIGEADEDGFITIRDRSKDMIISGGENVYPAEIEDVLMRHKDVLEVAVIGQPDAKWGETPLAIVVRRDAANQAEDGFFCELDALSAENLAKFKRPHGYRLRDQLPRNASGKVLKHVLRDEYGLTGGH